MNSEKYRDSTGFYTREYLNTLSPREILSLFIRETSYQETLNTVRKVINDIKKN